MSAPAAAPALAIVPPDAPPPPALSPAERERRVRRVRTICTRLCVTGALLPLPCAAAAPWLHGWEYLGMAVSWVFLLPAGGLALLVCAVAGRTREDGKAMLLSVGVVMAGFALLGPAARAGTEAYVSSHAAELDALAVRARTLLSGVPQDRRLNDDQRAVLDRLHQLGLTFPWFVEGGLYFERSAFFSPDLVYADGGSEETGSACWDVRHIGGRWYTAGCSISGREPVEW